MYDFFTGIITVRYDEKVTELLLTVKLERLLSIMVIIFKQNDERVLKIYISIISVYENREINAKNRKNEPREAKN